MKKSEQTRNHIIEKTMELIQEGSGDIDKITVRNIAERADVGMGLINHYFQSKNILIEICIQRMITGVVTSFHPELKKDQTGPEGVTAQIACQVTDFLINHPQISKISILGDMKSPAAADNTMMTVKGFASSIAGAEEMQNEAEIAFMLVAVLQVAFLRKDTLEQALGIDFNDKKQRDQFIMKLVEKLMV